MRKLLAAALTVSLLALGAALPAEAHHKPGHNHGPRPTTTAPATTTTTAPTTTTTTTTPPPPTGRYPVGVWFESALSPSDISGDMAYGLNTYVVLTRNSSLSALDASGVDFFAQRSEWAGVSHPGITGWELHDEIDMQRPPAEGCAELRSAIASIPSDGKPRYNNFGKGVTFWETDAEASCYVNSALDILSADNYWFTDNNICGFSEGGSWFGNRNLTQAECHLASNYGLTVDRVRYLDGLDGVRKAVWAFVEVGHPFTESSWPSITPVQIRAAVWHSVIAGAQGIIYFNHSFGGPCPTQHALREPCYAAARSTVTTVNAQLQALASDLAAPLQAQTASGPVRARRAGSTIIAGATTAAGGLGTFSVPGASSVEVLYEGRTLPVVNGSFSDSFADGNAVHLYRVT